MKRNPKKTMLTWLLTAAMLLSLLPTVALAADTVDSGTCGDNLTWTLDEDGVLTISGTGDMYDWGYYTEVTSPDNVAPWFGDYGYHFIESVIIEDSVTSIGDAAFAHCGSLTSVTVGNSVTSIGHSAFRDCVSLTDIDIPDSVTTIDNTAFAESGLMNLAVGSGVTTIGTAAFWYCESLTSITISNSVTSIGNSAFANCTGLTSVTIPDSVTSIGEYAFEGCTSLTDIYYAGSEEEWAAIVGDNNNATLKEYGVTIHYNSTGPEKNAEFLFTDVTNTAASYYTPVYWAYDSGITKGTSATAFSPSATCTRAQFVTFLWRLAGEPEPASSANPFTDVTNTSASYYKAVLWAVEQGVTKGTSATTFSPSQTITRAQAVTFLYRYAGEPAVSASSSFTDVTNTSASYYKAVIWAVEKGITNGTTATTFSPSSPCTRGQMVTFLYRFAVEPVTT